MQNAPTDRRPFIHPIVAPGWRGTVTENAPGHHPWQHGLYIGLNDVNGYRILARRAASPIGAATDGTFHPRIVGVPRRTGNRATWALPPSTATRTGAALLARERRNGQFTDHGDRYDLDLVWTLTPT